MAGMNFQTRPGPVYILSWGNRNGNNTFTELAGNPPLCRRQTLKWADFVTVKRKAERLLFYKKTYILCLILSEKYSILSNRE